MTWCLLSIRDTGIGIPPAKQRLIFDPFAQADSSTTREYGGTGLGLTISSRLAQLMGGTIWLESEAGRGTTFYVRVGFGTASAQVPEPNRPDLSALEGVRVLIVDDNATNRQILEEFLTRWRMQPTSVENGPSALLCMERASQAGEPFSLVMLDACMPGMDGFMLAEAIKNRNDSAAAKLMMLTSTSQGADMERCRTLGIGAYLVKPIKRSELLKAVLVAVAGVRPVEPVVNVRRPAVTRPLRILLAEDNAVNQILAVRLLERSGHSVVVANTGLEAVSAVSAEVFDLVLMDVQMPEMNGIEATRAIRDAEKTTGGHIRILAMTAAAMAGDREQCLEAGMDGYISKPINIQKLLELIGEDSVEQTPVGQSLS